jgi:hypothetical protein
MAYWYGLKGWVRALSGERAVTGQDAVAPIPAAPDPEAAGPMGAARHLLGAEVCARKILLVADPASQMLDHAVWLDDHTGGVILCNGLGQVREHGAQLGDAAIVLIGIDHFTDLDTAIEALAEFRMAAPGLPVVIGSIRFDRPDLSTQRAMIADASIRLPVGRPQLALALGAAVTNHRAVRSRLDHFGMAHGPSGEARLGVPFDGPSAERARLTT